MIAVQDIGTSLRYASNKLRDNYDIVMAAVSRNGWSLKYASEELRDNYNIVMVAVENCGTSLEYASDRLQNNYNIAIHAVKNGKCNLCYVGKELQGNYKILNSITDLCKDQTGFPEKLKKFKNHQGWIKGHVGNELKLYNNDFDIKLLYE